MQDLVKREAWFMSTGLDQLKHIVVLMMENRSFDHMLGSLKAIDSRIDGVTDQLSNPDTTGASVKPQPLAEFQGQLNPDPDHHFAAGSRPPSSSWSYRSSRPWPCAWESR